MIPWVDPVAYVVDSSGEPVTREDGSKIGIYYQKTKLPANKKGIHTVWISDEPFGDTFPFPKDAPLSQLPTHLINFMAEARTGTLSSRYRLTEWGRYAADTFCQCPGGRLEEAGYWPNGWSASKKDERGGLNSKAWKKKLRRERLEREGKKDA